ncbi:ATP-binding cassette domain-containing protein [Actinomadura napierensis]|uniref:ATP-binding cassette domain-containing protein n=2 Tax=Actinomadura napierensis TaxID=267854 RepID=A0ABN2Z653_9ACTN
MNGRDAREPMARATGSRALPYGPALPPGPAEPRSGGAARVSRAAHAADTLTAHDRSARGDAARWEPLGMAVTPVLDMRGIDKSFGSVKVLQDIAFSAYPGEVTALVGDNGAGKTTLVKCIGGIHPPDAGEYRFEGRPVRLGSPRDAAALGIEVVHQDLALCENLDIVQNLFLGRERRRGIALDESGMEELARTTLSGLSVRTMGSVRQKISTLSGGQRQTVAIARAVLWDSKLVVLDEPAAALGVAQTQQVLEIVRRLADKGLAVVLISHNMNDVFAVSDRIAALYLGRMVAQVRTADVTHRQVVELITSGVSGDLGLRR